MTHEKIVYSMYFSDSKGNKVEPAHYGIEHEAIDSAHDVVIFEDFGNGQTKLTLIGNETIEDAKTSGQVEGWIQILDEVTAVVKLRQEVAYTHGGGKFSPMTIPASAVWQSTSVHGNLRPLQTRF